MRIFNPIIQSSSTKIFVCKLLILAIYLGCGPKNASPDSPTALSDTQPTTIQKAIILFQDINPRETLKNLQDKLTADFPDSQVIILERKNTQTKSIKQQAEDIFDQLKQQQLSNKYLMLWGDGQGGLLAFSLYNQYKSQLQIAGLITNHTPWEGIPAIQASDKYIHKAAKIFAALLKTKLKSFQKDIPPLLKERALKGLLQEIVYHSIHTQPGIQDLIPQSPFLQEIAQNLHQATIPIWILGGHKVDGNLFLKRMIAAYVEKNSTVNTQQVLDILRDIDLDQSHFRQAWLTIIGMDTDENKDSHNYFMPVSSQTAQNINKPTDLKKTIWKGYYYGTRPDSPGGDKIYQKTTDFINACFQKTANTSHP